MCVDYTDLNKHCPKDPFGLPRIMTAQRLDETLLIYIAATSRVISTAIVVEHEEVGHAYKVRRPVYFISEVLNEPKTHYP